MGPILKLPLSFDASKLQRDLHNLEQHNWVNHFVAQNYEGAWDILPLRGQAGATHPIQQCFSNPGCHDWEDTDFLNASPYFQELLAQFKCNLECIRLMNLGPGSTIKPHSDHDLDYSEGQVRLHIPITTNPGVLFHMHNQTIHMAAGECWYMRFSDTHSVENRGTNNRVHMVIDAKVNDWLCHLFEQSEAA